MQLLLQAECDGVGDVDSSKRVSTSNNVDANRLTESDLPIEKGEKIQRNDCRHETDIDSAKDLGVGGIHGSVTLAAQVVALMGLYRVSDSFILGGHAGTLQSNHCE